MTESTPQALGLARGPAAYRLTATRLHADELPYMVLECPYECTGTLLHGRYRRSAELDTLLRAAINHDRQHASPAPAEAAEHAGFSQRLNEHMATLGEYRLSPDMDEHPFLIMDCPYLGNEAGRCPDTAEEGSCVTNLLPQEVRIRGVDLGALLPLAAQHEVIRAQGVALSVGQLLAELDQAVSGG